MGISPEQQAYARRRLRRPRGCFPSTRRRSRRAWPDTSRRLSRPSTLRRPHRRVRALGPREAARGQAATARERRAHSRLGLRGGQQRPQHPARGALREGRQAHHGAGGSQAHPEHRPRRPPLWASVADSAGSSTQIATGVATGVNAVSGAHPPVVTLVDAQTAPRPSDGGRQGHGLQRPPRRGDAHRRRGVTSPTPWLLVERRRRPPS